MIADAARAAESEFDDDPPTQVDAFADVAMEDLIRAAAWLPLEIA